ncbi:ethanolamine ammonia-lyase subunit EutC [Pandoraea sputorum]|uniref:ethanolamine ammonia-lyase subunit EutC n=1 Tax=Pandoraea sputorum TaxID=93222 RepID=UPI001241FFCB|nr:ethanolamine ammonia-lyase subunit EutC [Pandoraea sputorum]
MTDTWTKNAWQSLREFTTARIALGRTGNSLPTEALLAFNLAHAQARDAVHRPLDVRTLCTQLEAANFNTIEVCSAAPDRAHYLRRPDLGRRLSAKSCAALQSLAHEGAPSYDVVFVIADGLSAFAAMRHPLPLLQLMQSMLPDWRIGPVVVAAQGRVAIGDEIGELLRAKIVVVLIGERPGLSSPDSLGVYITFEPRIGRNDAERNCISNVRPEGLGYAGAAHKLHYLLTHARRLGLSGVDLKDDSDSLLTTRSTTVLGVDKQLGNTSIERTSPDTRSPWAWTGLSGDVEERKR